MPVFVTQVEGDNLLLVETETTASLTKSESEIRANPMAAFDNALEAIGRIGRVASAHLAQGTGGSQVETVDLQFGIKIDQTGAVMIAMQNQGAQFTVQMRFRAP